MSADSNKQNLFQDEETRSFRSVSSCLCPFDIIDGMLNGG